ncbi:MAG: hypothetical protein GEU97_02340 [Actinophytocola sp.]|nr:hypothetical protein [Actinophytocola sp.]
MRGALAVVRAAREAELAAEYVGDTDDVSEPRIRSQRSSAVLRELRTVATPEAMRPLGDTRLVALAGGLSQHAAASRRLELYPRDL